MLAVTYIADSLITLGGDWEELGRTILPTRVVARSIKDGRELSELHSFCKPQDVYKPDGIISDSDSAFAHVAYLDLSQIPEEHLQSGFILHWQVPDSSLITFCDIIAPIAELAILKVPQAF